MNGFFIHFRSRSGFLMAIKIFFLASICTTSRAVLLNYVPPTRPEVTFFLETRQWSHTSILYLLLRILTLRHWKIGLQKVRCRRHGIQSDLDEIVEVVQKELRGNGSVLGYKAIYRRRKNHYGLVTLQGKLWHEWQRKRSAHLL